MRLLDDAPAARASVAERQRRWRGWWRRPALASGCLVCCELAGAEPRLLRWFLLGLRGVRFARAFRAAGPICLTHESRLATAMRAQPAEFEAAQRAKVENLRQRLLRHEALADNPHAVEAALRYLFSKEAAPWLARCDTAALDGAFEESPAETATNFEIAKLRREVEDLTRRLGEAESRAASLHYRVAVLASDNRDWAIRYAGLAAQARALEADLRTARAESHGS